MALMLNGMGVSRGVSIGDVFILRRNCLLYTSDAADE